MSKRPLEEREGNTKKPENNEKVDKREIGGDAKRSGETGRHEGKSEGDNRLKKKDGKKTKETKDTKREVMNEKEPGKDNLECKVCDVVLDSQRRLKAHLESSKHHRACWSSQGAGAARRGGGGV